MGQKTDEIKVRIEPLDKKAFEQIARDRDVSVAHVAREALREFLERHSRAPMVPAQGGARLHHAPNSVTYAQS